MQKNQKRYSPLVLALLSISSMLIFTLFVQPMNEANALTPKETSAGNTNVWALRDTGYCVSAGHCLAVDIEGSISAGDNPNVMRVIDENTSVTYSTLNFSSSLQSGAIYAFENLSCDISGSGLCALAEDTGSGGKVSRVILLDTVNNIASGLSSGYNFTSGVVPTVAISKSQPTSTVFMGYLDSGSNHFKVVIGYFNTSQSVNIPSNRIVAQITSDSGFNGYQPTNAELGSFQSGANQGNYVAWMSNAGLFVLYRASTNTFPCSVSLGGSSGDIDFVQNSAGNYWFATAHTTNIKKVDFSCNVLATSDFTASTGGNVVMSLTHSPTLKQFYFLANSKIFVGNLTSFSATPIAQYAYRAGYGTALPYNAMFSNDRGTLGTSGTTYLATIEELNGNPNFIYWLYWGNVGSGTGSSGTTCNAGGDVFINSQGQCCVQVYNTNGQVVVATYCSSGQGSNFHITVGQAGSLGTLRSGQNITQTGAQYLCATGLDERACSLGNPQTNGTGYWLLLVLILGSLIFVYGLVGMVSSHYNMEVVGSLLAVPKELIIIVLMVDLGIAFFSGWTDGLAFYTFIVVMVGLAGLGITTFIMGRVQSR